MKKILFLLVLVSYAPLHAQNSNREEVRVAHILVSSEQKARDIMRDASKPDVNFSEVALVLSEDPGSKIRGGDLGFFKRGQMVPEFEEKAFSMQPGDIDIVKTQFGWHVIKMLEYRLVNENSFNMNLGVSGTIITDAEITALTDYISVSSSLADEDKDKFLARLRELPKDYSTEENAKQIVAYVKSFETDIKGNTVERLRTGNAYLGSTRDILGRIQQRYSSGVVAAWLEEEVDTHSTQDKLTELELTVLGNFVSSSGVKEKLEEPLSTLPQDYSTEENAQKIISFIAMFETDIKGNTVENLTEGKIKNATTSGIVSRIQSKYGSAKVLGWFEAKSPAGQEDAVVFGDEAPDYAYEIEFKPSYNLEEEFLSRKLSFPALSQAPSGGEPQKSEEIGEMVARRLAEIATDQAKGIEGLGKDLIPVIDQLKVNDAKKVEESGGSFKGYDYGRMITSVIVQDEKEAAKKCVQKFVADEGIAAMLKKPRHIYGMMMVARIDKKFIEGEDGTEKQLIKYYCGTVLGTEKTQTADNEMILEGDTY